MSRSHDPASHPEVPDNGIDERPSPGGHLLALPTKAEVESRGRFIDAYFIPIQTREANYILK